MAHPLAGVQGELTEGNINKLLAPYNKTLSDLVVYFVRDEEKLRTLGKAGDELGVPSPLLSAIVASVTFRRSVYNAIFFNSFSPGVLAQGFEKLAERLLSDSTSTKDLIAIIKLIADTHGIEARQRVTHDVNVAGGIKVQVEVPFSPEQVFGKAEVIDAEYREAPALPRESEGELVHEAPEFAREDAQEFVEVG